MAKNSLETRLKDLERLRSRGTITDDEYASRRAALLNDTSEAVAARSKGSGILRWGTRGCLGLLALVGALVVVIIVIVAVAANSASDNTGDAGGDVRVALAVGASGVISPERNGSKRSKVTILEIADNAQSTNRFLQPPAGKKYWAVRVEVENVGTSEVTSLDWKLRDSLDNEVERSVVTGVGEELDLIYSDLTPGGKKSGWVVFAIPTDASPKWLRADPNPFLAYDLYFDAP